MWQNRRQILKAPEKGKEEMHKATVSLTAAEEICLSCSCGCFIRTSWHFHIQRKRKNSTKGFSLCKRYFHCTPKCVWWEFCTAGQPQGTANVALCTNRKPLDLKSLQNAFCKLFTRWIHNINAFHLSVCYATLRYTMHNARVPEIQCFPSSLHLMVTAKQKKNLRWLNSLL